MHVPSSDNSHSGVKLAGTEIRALHKSLVALNHAACFIVAVSVSGLDVDISMLTPHHPRDLIATPDRMGATLRLAHSPQPITSDRELPSLFCAHACVWLVTLCPPVPRPTHLLQRAEEFNGCGPAEECLFCAHACSGAHELITFVCTCMQWLRALLITVGVAQIPMVQSEQQGFSLHQAITMWLWTVLITWVLLTLVAWLLDRKVRGSYCMCTWHTSGHTSGHTRWSRC